MIEQDKPDGEINSAAAGSTHTSNFGAGFAQSSVFECNICLDTAKEPVVTPCGHLYCWKCIYEWIQQPRDTMVCPVCKSGISQDMLTPIFTKDNNEDPRAKKSESE